MKSVKIMLAAVLIAASFGTAAIAQTTQTKSTKNTSSAPALKEHKCTGKCNSAGHSYAHGEKGHTCTAECKKAPAKKA